MDKAIKMLKAFKERNGNFYYMGEEMNIDEVIAELEALQLVTSSLVFVWDETEKKIEGIRAYRIPNEIVIDKSKDYEILIREAKNDE